MAKSEIDMGEVRQFAAVLNQVGDPLMAEVRPVVAKGALNIKTQLRAEMSASRHFKGFARGISYTLQGNAFTSIAEIGPEKGGPGAGANLAYFGTSRGGGTVPDPRGALDAEAGPFMEAIADIAERLPAK